MSEPKLLGCPFCGHKHITIGYQGQSATTKFAMCQMCGASGPPVHPNRPFAELAEKWNTRAKPEHGEG